MSPTMPPRLRVASWVNWCLFSKAPQQPSLVLLPLVSWDTASWSPQTIHVMTPGDVRILASSAPPLGLDLQTQGLGLKAHNFVPETGNGNWVNKTHNNTNKAPTRDSQVLLDTLRICHTWKGEWRKRQFMELSSQRQSLCSQTCIFYRLLSWQLQLSSLLTSVCSLLISFSPERKAGEPT